MHFHFLFFFFFSSRRRHTRCGRDWSSDVCSSDLDRIYQALVPAIVHAKRHIEPENADADLLGLTDDQEERVAELLADITALAEYSITRPKPTRARTVARSQLSQG